MKLTVMHGSDANGTAIRMAGRRVRTRDVVRGLLDAPRSWTMRSVIDMARRGVTRAATLGAVMVPAVLSAQPAQLRVVQPTGATVNAATVPYMVGEELTYRATFGGIPAGTARMRVDGVEIVRGRAAYHVVFLLDGGIPF